MTQDIRQVRSGLMACQCGPFFHKVLEIGKIRLLSFLAVEFSKLTSTTRVRFWMGKRFMAYS
ncbi:hypothetical protein SAMN05660860_02105 [Geoalkalibacter ferrihydriticus]|uniref:Uncharacterized protein n=1 Tax=Geoalkalibacter ferrihydriticus TaxID=392333 RepID=A0A1G9RCU1_9BACT|nr:hypothetical protein SAMN05660860_02105 [Geoalkalibacter ferrihydriticus]